MQGKTEKRRRIDNIYKVLALYEDAIDNNNTVTMDEYLTYVGKLAILYRGLDNKEFYGLLNGIRMAGMNVRKSELKSIVFHMINVIDKEDADGLSMV